MATSAVDLSSLTPDQQLAVQQFTAVTDQEASIAVPLLRSCQWNAQVAITRFFDGGADLVDPEAEAARSPAPAQNARRTETLVDSIPAWRRLREDGPEPAYRVAPTPESQLIQPVPFPLSMILFPFNLFTACLQRAFGFVGFFFPFLPRLLARLYSGRASQPSRDAGRKPLNPRDTAARFIREFEEEWGVTHGTLPFYEGGYAQAFDYVKRELKYLFVVLLSPEHDDTAPFVRDTLLSPDFVQFIKQSSDEIVMWAGTVQDSEAYQVSSSLGATRFPYASLIVHTPSVPSSAMCKVATFTGPIAAADLIAKMIAAMQTHNQELERVRAQRREQLQNRNLRQQQETAYERSLAQDREKARRRQEEEEAREKAEREEREKAERKADAARKLAQWRRWRAYSIPSEPGSDVTDAIRISLRMPSGERIVRRFRSEADLEELYGFVECYSVLQEMDTVPPEKEPTEPAGYEHVYGFNLVSPVPREVFDLAKGGSIGGRIGRSGNLIVEKIISEDDDSSDDDDDYDDEKE